MLSKLKGLAVGIGSLPYQDAESALDLIFQYLPSAPFWPQLPKRDMREGMIIQFSQNLPCLRLTSGGLVFNPQDKDKELEVFYERLIEEDVDYFGISREFALGLGAFYQRLKRLDIRDIEVIKCQVTGPFTFAAGLKDDKGIALLHDKVFMQVILKALALKALWQIRLFREFNKKIVLFVDEPYLGCFGSAYTPLNRQDIVKGLSEFAKTIKSPDVLVGAHCCGNTDWSILTDAGGIDIISFDAFEFLDRLILYADNLKGFFKRGGILCWGIVPTQSFSGKETPELLAGKIKEGIEELAKKGLEKDLIAQNLLISPSCGLGTFTPERAGEIFKLLSETSLFLRRCLSTCA